MNTTNTENTIYNRKTISSQREQETRKIVTGEYSSSIDPSLIKDLLRNDDPDRSKKKGYTLENDEGIHIDDNEEGHLGFSSELVDIDEQEDQQQMTSGRAISDEHKEYFVNSEEGESPINNKIKYRLGMEKISEAEIEDEKYTTLFDKINEEALKDEYKLNERNLDKILKANINKNNLKNYFNPALYDTENREYSFKPEINQNSRHIALSKTKSESNISRSKSPVEFDLYADAIKRKEKLQKIEYHNMMEIMLNASKTKISNNSHRIAIMKIERWIEEVIQQKEKQKRLNFIDIGEVLWELRIFREVFDHNAGEQDSKRYKSYKDIRQELKNTKESERRKRAEIDFYEQFWMILNPDNKELIKSDIAGEFLKILFSPVASSVKEISSVLKQFLSAAFFLNSEASESKTFISPITEKTICENEIWPLEKLVREFLGLKENMLAYQQIKNVSKKTQDEIAKSERENLSFQPNATDKKYVSRSNFFQERVQALMDRDRLRKQVLEEMKKENEEVVSLNFNI
jgi:hypothetical protein